jgi:arsenate reductase
MGIIREKLANWCDHLGWEKVLNQKGLTYKKLSDSEKELIIDKNSAIDYMSKATSSIKRPLIETEKGILLGFIVEEYRKEFL